MTTLKFRSVLALLAATLVLWAWNSPGAQDVQGSPALEAQASKKEKAMLVQYLEIVTPDVDATCSALEKLHGVGFGHPDAALGNARTARLESGGRIGVRAPMREDEEPVVRPYVLVDDIEAAVKAAEAAGGELPPMEDSDAVEERHTAAQLAGLLGLENEPEARLVGR